MRELPEAFESVLGIIREGTLIVETVFYDEDEFVWRRQYNGQVVYILDWFPIPQKVRDSIKNHYENSASL